MPAAERSASAENGDRTAAGLPLWRMAVLAVVAGTAIGLVGALFRLALMVAEKWRVTAVSSAHHLGLLGLFLVIVGVASCAAFARLLVRWAPEAAGSGVQRVEAVDRGQEDPARARVLPVKFVGGAVALGAGLVLGREGPTVQMGASIADILSRVLRVPDADMRDLQTATAGAGLGVAFGAPMGGAIFTFEEVRRRPDGRLAVASLLAAGTAWTVGSVILGRSPMFIVGALRPAGWQTSAAALLFGAALGALGVAYNRLVIGTKRFVAAFTQVPAELRAAAIGAIVGLALWFEPSVLAGSDATANWLLRGSLPLATIAILLVARWLLGPISYAAGTPGGLFAPLLVVGALLGVLFANWGNWLVPALRLSPGAFVIIGMSTFFAATVRAPLTGVALVAEMAATTTQVVPMLIAAATAMLVASALGGRPIYDTLRMGMLQREGKLPEEDLPSDGDTRGRGLPTGAEKSTTEESTR